VPLSAATAAVLVVGLVAVVRATHRNLTDTEVPPISFDSITGYRDAAMTVARIPPEGSVVGATQSGAFGYYAGDRLEVVNLDGVVNPDAADALEDGTTVAYMRDRGVDWVADFALHLVEFVVQSRQQMDPPPKVEAVKDLPQFPPFPGYALAKITWPPRAAGDGG
jgi:hypothetical protein